MSVKILFIDIETAPETAYIWKRFKETVGQTQVKEPGYLLCMAWAWMDEDVQNVQIYNTRAWCRGDKHNDFNIVKKAHELLCEADMVVGHNIKSFDLATLNARFVFYGLPPPTPYKTCDTIEILKKRFRLPSNSLESASHYFGIKAKDKQPFTLWRNCLNGDANAWSIMITYCMHDVTVVRELYKKLMPWADQHPNLGLYDEDGGLVVCPKCGGRDLIKKGIYRTTVHYYQQYQCKDCGGWSRGRIPLKRERNHVLTHAVVA